MKKLTADFVCRVYREWLNGRGLARGSIAQYVGNAERYFRYLLKTGIDDVREAGEEEILNYREQVCAEPVSSGVKAGRLQAVKDVYGLCKRQGRILYDPFDRLEVRIRREPAFRRSLSEDEMSRFLDGIPVAGSETLRDRAFFELLYVTGMRVGEGLNLNVGDVDLGKQEVFIRQGKWRKDRIVPLGRISGEYLKAWLEWGRPKLVGCRKEEALFVGSGGKRLSKERIRARFSRYLKAAGIPEKKLVIHSIRHSCATHLLLHGADLRYVQELLGHETIETTSRYTRGIADHLKKIQKRFHPVENQLYEDGPDSGEQEFGLS